MATFSVGRELGFRFNAPNSMVLKRLKIEDSESGYYGQLGESGVFARNKASFFKAIDIKMITWKKRTIIQGRMIIIIDTLAQTNLNVGLVNIYAPNDAGERRTFFD
ncbi:hypothetical protein GQ457_05G023890 [Hibiscus cannabinus]